MDHQRKGYKNLVNETNESVLKTRDGSLARNYTWFSHLFVGKTLRGNHNTSFQALVSCLDHRSLTSNVGSKPIVAGNVFSL